MVDSYKMWMILMFIVIEKVILIEKVIKKLSESDIDNYWNKNSDRVSSG